MDKIISGFLENLKLGQLQIVKNMGVIPIFCKAGRGPEYLTLKEALDMDLLTITELDSAGSVPRLKAFNKSKTPVLILDGEELTGAKQNRVLNASVLLKEESETVIPVSCTEQGRWSYKSKKFYDSDIIAAQKVRLCKNFSVNKSLNLDRTFFSDQGAVWNDTISVQTPDPVQVQ